MKYLKYFNESDSWAGSLYAYNNPEIKPKQQTIEIPLFKTKPYKCLDCDATYHYLESGGEPICPLCKSKNSEEIHLKKYNKFVEDATANASISGSGDVTNAIVGDVAGTGEINGSGDIVFTTKKVRRKKGDATQVSDLRDLEKAKTTKIVDIKESYDEEEYFIEIETQLKDKNITPSDLIKILDFYNDDIIKNYEEGKPPRVFVDKIVKELEIGSGGYFNMQFSQIKQPIIKYL